MRGYEGLCGALHYSPQWSPWLKANRKKPRAATTFSIAQLLQITSLHQTYINRCKDANRIGQCSIMTSIPGSKEPGIFCCLWHICQPPLSSIQWGQINRKVVHSSEKHQIDVFHWQDYKTMVTERKETEQMQSTFEKLGAPIGRRATICCPIWKHRRVRLMPCSIYVAAFVQHTNAKLLSQGCNTVHI